MKLTDEQREHWNEYIEWAKRNKLRQVTIDLTALEPLLSSELSWRKEAEEATRNIEKLLADEQSWNDEIEFFKKQLNQAIEVLREIETFQRPDLDDSVRIRIMKDVARDFLSSLDQKENTHERV